MASYQKGLTKDKNKEENGIEVAEEININDRTRKGEHNVYESMHNVGDNENYDDDKILINGDLPYRGGRRERKKGLIIHILLVLLCVSIIILSYFVSSLNRDLGQIKVRYILLLLLLLF